MTKDFFHFPEDLKPDLRCQFEELASNRPFLVSFLRSALPPSFWATWRRTGVERYPIPLADQFYLWAFEFQRENNVTLALVWEARGRLIPVDFRNTTFTEVIGFNGCSSEIIKTHYALYATLWVETGLGKTVGNSFVPNLLEIPRPDSVSVERWAEILAKATSPEKLGIIDRRKKQLIEIAAGEPDRILAEDLYFPAETARELVGRDFPWHGKTLPALDFSLEDRRANRLTESSAALSRYRTWIPSGFHGDAEAVTRNALASYEQRCRENPWVEIFPGADAATIPEAQELFTQLNERCLDYYIPPAWLSSTPDPQRNELRVRRKTLSFYPGFCHYVLTDRRGGHPRRSEILFAPFKAPIPIEEDRLIPLNGSSPFIHRLNQAHGLNLTEATAAEYIDFFCDAVHGNGGPFHILESLDDAEWRGGASDQKNLLADVLKPIRLWPDCTLEGAADKDVFIADALLVYASELFHVRFHLFPHGFIKMEGDDPLGLRLDVVPEILSKKTHFLLGQPLAPAGGAATPRP